MQLCASPLKLYGSIGALLQTTAEIRVNPGRPTGYSAHAVADYSHTLGLVGATLRDSKGNVLAGWSLADVDSGAILKSLDKSWRLERHEGGYFTLLKS